MNQHQKIRPASSDFKSCFAAVAAYLGRPSAETVLFSGVPLSSDKIEIDEINNLAERIGLEVEQFDSRDFRRGRFDLPAIVFRAKKPPIALLREIPDGDGYVTAPQENGRTSIRRRNLPPRQVAAGVSFSISYANSMEGMNIGLAQKIERRHWLTGTLERLLALLLPGGAGSGVHKSDRDSLADLHHERL